MSETNEKTFEQGARCITCTKSLTSRNTGCSRSVHACQHVVLCDECFAQWRKSGNNSCPVCRAAWPPFNPLYIRNTEGFTGLVPDPNRGPGIPPGYVYDSGSEGEGQGQGRGSGSGSGQGEASGSGGQGSGNASASGNRRRSRRRDRRGG